MYPLPGSNTKPIQKRRRQERRLSCIWYLGGRCLDCGNKDVDVLEFDHREGRGGNDRRTIANMLLWSWDRLVAELIKCDLVCGNCHNKRTRSRAGWELDTRG